MNSTIIIIIIIISCTIIAGGGGAYWYFYMRAKGPVAAPISTYGFGALRSHNSPLTTDTDNSQIDTSSSPVSGPRSSPVSGPRSVSAPSSGPVSSPSSTTLNNLSICSPAGCSPRTNNSVRVVPLWVNMFKPINGKYGYNNGQSRFLSTFYKPEYQKKPGYKIRFDLPNNLFNLTQSQVFHNWIDFCKAWKVPQEFCISYENENDRWTNMALSYIKQFADQNETLLAWQIVGPTVCLIWEWDQGKPPDLPEPKQIPAWLSPPANLTIADLDKFFTTNLAFQKGPEVECPPPATTACPAYSQAHAAAYSRAQVAAKQFSKAASAPDSGSVLEPASSPFPKISSVSEPTAPPSSPPELLVNVQGNIVMARSLFSSASPSTCPHPPSTPTGSNSDNELNITWQTGVLADIRIKQYFDVRVIYLLRNNVKVTGPSNLFIQNSISLLRPLTPSPSPFIDISPFSPSPSPFSSPASIMTVNFSYSNPKSNPYIVSEIINSYMVSYMYPKWGENYFFGLPQWKNKPIFTARPFMEEITNKEEIAYVCNLFLILRPFKYDGWQYHFSKKEVIFYKSKACGNVSCIKTESPSPSPSPAVSPATECMREITINNDNNYMCNFINNNYNKVIYPSVSELSS